VALVFEIDGIGGLGDVGLERSFLGAPLPTEGSVPYADFESTEGPKPPELPDGQYRLTVSTAVGSITTQSLTPGGDEFEYVSAGVRNVDIFFTVPEPGAAGLGVVLAAVLARRRRRDATRQVQITNGSAELLVPLEGRIVPFRVGSLDLANDVVET